MKILNIIHDSIVDGTGLRVVVFFAGCPHKCRGCHNPESWNIHYGDDYSTDDVISEIKTNKITRGVTLSGGDPFFQSGGALELAKKLKDEDYNLWAYTGYTYEQIISDLDKKKLLLELDVLVDGRFDESLKDLTLKFRGSSNQRIIDVQKSLGANRVIIYNE